MKKLILFLLIGALLVLPLSGCFAGNKQNEGTTPNNTTENTTPEVTTPGNNQNNPPISNMGELQDENSKLIETLVDYLKKYWIISDPTPTPLADYIDAMKNGEQPIHVTFDTSNYYFVSGYCTLEHEDEARMYCCPEKYVWVKYDDASQIQEYYNEQKCVVTFQMNKSLKVENLLSKDADVSEWEHFQIYEPTFADGTDTATPITFEESFIYPFTTEQAVIYYTVDIYSHEELTIPCVCLEGEYYVSFWLDSITEGETFHPEESLSQASILYDFGEYYDIIVDLMDTETYRVTNEQGYTHCYGLISIEDFVDILSE